MNRKKLRWIPVAVVALAGIFWILNPNRQQDGRAAYEDYLRTAYDQMPTEEPQVMNDDHTVKPDRPDLAAFNDYIKTLDPATGTVPRERLMQANLLTRQLMNLKSGVDEPVWEHHPTDMGGRARVLIFDPNDPLQKKMWAGSVTGGLWYNNDPLSGEPWMPVDDFWPNLSVSSLTYDPNDTQTLYAGTGESQTALVIYRESSGRGTGMFRSRDGGASWHPIPSTSGWAYVTDILVRNEAGSSVIYAGVVSGIYKGVGHGSNPSDGLYRSTDGGDTWTQVLPNIPGSEKPYAPSDIDVTADNGRIFVGTTYGITDDASGNDRSGAGCLLWSDDGINWTVNDTYNAQMVAAGKYPGRVMLCKAPSDPNVMVAIVASGYVRSDRYIGYGCEYLLKTTDKGATWNTLNFPSGFASLAWHAFVVQVSPFNHNVIWVGGLDVHRTTNGGTDWVRLSNWAEMYGNGSPKYVHADIHVILFKPGTDNEVYIATDGGIFGSRSAASPTNVIFFELNRNFSTLQYYSGAIHPDAGAHHFIGGLQDNGTMLYKRNDVPTFTDMLSGGDGAICFIDYDNPAWHITTVYHNSIYLWSGDKETDPRLLRSRSFNSGMFVNAMDYDWKNDILFANGTNEQGDNKNTLLVVGITESNLNGTLRNINTQSQVSLSAIKWSEYSPENLSTLFMGSQSGRFWKYEDASHNGTLTELTGTNFPTANISSIDIGQSESNLLVTFSNYGVSSVFISRNGGQSWIDIEGNLPDMPVRWGIFHPEHDIEVMLATEAGVWMTRNILADPVVWTPVNRGLANVRIDMLQYRKSDRTLLAATHGRGMYTTTWIPDPTSGTGDGFKSGEELTLFPNPTSGRFEIILPGGSFTRITVMDLSGRIVAGESYHQLSAGTRKSFDLTGEPKGIYLVRTETDGRVSSNRISIH